MSWRGIRSDRALWGAVLLLVGAMALFELTGLDLWLQDHFYNETTHRWLVDENEPVGRAIFYNGPKVLISAAVLAALIYAAGPARWREKGKLSRRGLWLAVLVMATVPVLAGVGKKYTNTFCPSEIRRYGGEVAYVKLCEPYPVEDRPRSRGGCFPAGHASGGFALLGFLAVRPTRRWRSAVVALALGLGWWMGTYQMLKGAHYLSHTITTMLVAWIVVLFWRRTLNIAPDPDKLENDKAAS
jgi:membrane-associated PAP2 superfamily phosphatase